MKAMSDSSSVLDRLPSLLWLTPRQENKTRTSPFQFSLLQALRNSGSVNEPMPERSMALNANSTEPKCASHHTLNELNSSAESISHSRNDIVPETSRSKARQAAPTFPVNFTLRHAFWNSVQLTWLSLSTSNNTRQAFNGCGKITWIKVCSSMSATGSGCSTSHSGGSQASSHQKSGNERKPQPYKSSEWYNIQPASLRQPSSRMASAKLPINIFLSEDHRGFLSLGFKRAMATLGTSHNAAQEPNCSCAHARKRASSDATLEFNSSKFISPSPSLSRPCHKSWKSMSKSCWRKYCRRALFVTRKLQSGSSMRRQARVSLLYFDRIWRIKSIRATMVFL
mmetsp:Transcript_26868/g.77767  ORF Transcript_26868/g.77767 Transcript_26868/m.77767 type:complete len:339 (-) Transcript_26868:983-1999(-)